MASEASTRRIGIVFALREERDGLLRVLYDARAPVYTQGSVVRWRSGSVEVTAVIGGVGAERCAAATADLLCSGLNGIVCAGFAGGLDPLARVGDVVVARRVTTRWNLAEPIECNPTLFASIPPGTVFGYRVLRGDLVTSETVARTAEEKRAAWEMTGALALDMESHAAAEMCRRVRVPFAAVRCVSDTADQNLPAEIETLLSAAHGLSRASLALRRPGLWPMLIRLRGQSRLAARNLGDVLGMMLLRLVRSR